MGHLPVFLMDLAVELNDELQSMAIEVDDEGTHWNLSAKLQVAQTPAA
jgi:hypothetical protein